MNNRDHPPLVPAQSRLTFLNGLHIIRYNNVKLILFVLPVDICFSYVLYLYSGSPLRDGLLEYLEEVSF